MLLRRPFGRRRVARAGRRSELRTLAESIGRAIANQPREQRVLVLSLRYWTTHVALESILAQALRLRGADVRLLTCGGGLPMCEVGWSRRDAPYPCDRCGYHTDRVAHESGMTTYRLADGLPWGDDGRRAPLSAGDPPPEVIGEIVRSSAMFVKSADPERTPQGRNAVGEFAISHQGIERAAEKVLDDFQPDVVLVNNGLFAAEAVVRRLAEQRGARVPSYDAGPRPNTLVFSQAEPVSGYDMGKAWGKIRERKLGPEQESRLDALMKERRVVHERGHEPEATDAASVRELLRISPEHYVFALFSNVTWDTASSGRERGFDSLIDWVVACVRQVEHLRNTTLVLRAHPGELAIGTSEPMADLVKKRIPRLPANVRVVAPDERLSSYALLDIADGVLAYTTTVGLEASQQGLPVIVAADAHYRSRGFTVDVDDETELAGRLRERPPRLSSEQHELARRYAYMYFFRLMIPFPAVSFEDRPLAVPTSAEALMPGRDPYLDFICDHILDGGDFLVPDELVCPTNDG